MKKTIRNRVAWLLAMVMLLACIPVTVGAADITADTAWYAEEDAEEFAIANAQQLAGLAKLVREGNTFSGKRIVLTADIVVNTGDASAWTDNAPALTFSPIGANGKPFSGCFDGNSHTISGLYVTGGYCGLFASTNGATVKNLTIANSCFKGTGTNVGAVSGNIVGNPSVWQNITVASDVIVNTTQWGGAMAGTVKAALTADDCRFGGAMTARQQHGGFVGVLESGKLTLTECSVTGSITAPKYAGGFVGLAQQNAEVELTNCLVDAQITATENTAAGIVGELQCAATVTGCVVEGSISNKGGSTGGFIGCSKENKAIVITDSLCTADVTGVRYAGGFVGWSMANPITLTDCIFDGTVSGTMEVGGLVGRSDNVGVALTRCLVRGKINATNAFASGAFMGAARGTTAEEKKIIFDNCYVEKDVADNISGTWKNLLGLSYIVKYDEDVFMMQSFSADVSDDATAKPLIAACFDRERSVVSSLDAGFVLLRSGFDTWSLAANTKTDLPLPTALASRLKQEIVLKGYQKSEVADGGYNIRLIAVLDELQYRSAGFIVSINGSDKENVCDSGSVYKAVLAKAENGITETVSAEHCGGHYILALTVKGFAVGENYTLSVTPFVRNDSDTVKGEIFTLTLGN